MSFVNLYSIRAVNPLLYFYLLFINLLGKDCKRGIFSLLFVAVHENDGKHFHQSDYNETNGAGEAVKHFQPVLSSTSTEDEPHEKAYDTNNSCSRKIRN